MDYAGRVDRGDSAVVIADFQGVTGLTPNAMISLVGAPFVPPVHGVTEVGLGYYMLVLSSTETRLTGPVVVNFVAGSTRVGVLLDVTDALQRIESIVKKWTTTQPNLATLSKLSDVDEHLTGLIRNVIGSQLTDLKQGKIRSGRVR